MVCVHVVLWYLWLGPLMVTGFGRLFRNREKKKKGVAQRTCESASPRAVQYPVDCAHDSVRSAACAIADGRLQEGTRGRFFAIL